MDTIKNRWLPGVGEGGTGRARGVFKAVETLYSIIMTDMLHTLDVQHPQGALGGARVWGVCGLGGRLVPGKGNALLWRLRLTCGPSLRGGRRRVGNLPASLSISAQT